MAWHALCEAPNIVPVWLDPEGPVLGVPDDMVIFHELTGIFVEDSGKDLLWVLVAHECAGIGCVLANIENSQHLFLGALADGCFDSGIVGWSGFFIGFYVGRGRGL